jgi:hypothetical protein
LRPYTLKLWCPEGTFLKRKREDDEDDDDDDRDDVKSKKWIDYEGNAEGDEDDEESVGRAYCKLLDLTKAVHDDERQQKIDKYVNEQGMTEEDTEQKVETKPQDVYLKTFLTQYCCILLHNQIIDSVKEYIADGFDVDKSIRRALKKHQHDLEAFVEEAVEEDDKEAKEEEEGEEEEEEEEEEKEEEDDSEEDGDEEENQAGQGLTMDIIMAAIPNIISIG